MHQLFKWPLRYEGLFSCQTDWERERWKTHGPVLSSMLESSAPRGTEGGERLGPRCCLTTPSLGEWAVSLTDSLLDTPLQDVTFHCEGGFILLMEGASTATQAVSTEGSLSS